MELAELGQAGVERMIAHMRESLHRFRVDFNEWFHEHTLHPGEVEHAFEVLEGQGRVYRSEGALWMRTTCVSSPNASEYAGGPPTASPQYAASRSVCRGSNPCLNAWLTTSSAITRTCQASASRSMPAAPPAAS